MSLTLKMGVSLVGLAFCVALLAPWIAPYDLESFDLASRLVGPTTRHPFGLDEEGRDLFSLILWGTRLSLGISLVTVTLAGLIGTVLGLSAGYFGGKWDHLFVFLTDVVLAFPSILLIVALAAFFREGGIFSVVGILAGVGWVGYARIVRGQVLSLKGREYILAAVGVGASIPRIWLNHLIPNLFAPLLVNATFGMAGVVLAESTLSFLGLGLPTDVPSWGRLLDQGVQYLLAAPHIAIFSGVSIALLILGFNLLGDGLRDFLDVKDVR